MVAATPTYLTLVSMNRDEEEIKKAYLVLSPSASSTRSSSHSAKVSPRLSISSSSKGERKERRREYEQHQQLETKLPATFQPGTFDVICAKGKEAKEHTGNRRFRLLVDMNLEKYKEAKTKIAKSTIVTDIVDAIRTSSPDGGFIKASEGDWYLVSDHHAREKVGQSFRDRLHTEYKSSSKAKIKKRKLMEDEAMVPFPLPFAQPDIVSSLSSQANSSSRTCRVNREKMTLTTQASAWANPIQSPLPSTVFHKGSDFGPYNTFPASMMNSQQQQNHLRLSSLMDMKMDHQMSVSNNSNSNIRLLSGRELNDDSFLLGIRSHQQYPRMIGNGMANLDGQLPTRMATAAAMSTSTGVAIARSMESDFYRRMNKHGSGGYGGGNIRKNIFRDTVELLQQGGDAAMDETTMTPPTPNTNARQEASLGLLTFSNSNQSSASVFSQEFAEDKRTFLGEEGEGGRESEDVVEMKEEYDSRKEVTEL